MLLPALFCAAAFFALAPAIAYAAIFDDGNDRHFVKELRAKANPTAKEKAILVAANKVGIIRTCDGREGGNAFLITYGGRPAVLTSGHLLVASETGKLLCGETQAMKAFYYPNARYYDPENEDNQYALIRRSLVYPPINLSAIVDAPFTMRSHKDWLVFLLDTDITADVMPDGSRRGALVGSTERASSGKLIMIGVAPDMAKGNRTLFQQGCSYVIEGAYTQHNCDTVKGSSGSMLGVYEDGEIRIRGAHNYAPMGNEKLPSEMTEIEDIWNGGTTIETVLADADKPLPEFLAYDIQLKLVRSGCYSGKLDNQLGPGSRKALATFAAAAATELPGMGPSPELLAAVEKAVPEGTVVCPR